jgi:hypothetical protein
MGSLPQPTSPRHGAEFWEGYVGTAALGCPVERSSTVSRYAIRRNALVPQNTRRIRSRRAPRRQQAGEECGGGHHDQRQSKYQRIARTHVIKKLPQPSRQSKCPNGAKQHARPPSIAAHAKSQDAADWTHPHRAPSAAPALACSAPRHTTSLRTAPHQPAEAPARLRSRPM